MNKKGVFFFFILSVGVLALFACFSPFSGHSVSNFQKKRVDATLLDRGETGKILKSLKYIVPVENKKRDLGLESNVIEVIERAKKDYKKWTKLEQYRKYQDEGIFCYFEMQTDGPEVPVVGLAKIDGQWQTIVDFAVRGDRVAYSFFVDINTPLLELQLAILNEEDTLKINTVAFLQKGYHPLVYSDPVSFTRFLSDFESPVWTITPNAIVLQPGDDAKMIKSKHRFKEKWMVGVSKFQKKQGDTKIAMTVRANHPLAEGRVSDENKLAIASKGRLPVLAIDVEEEDLYSEEFGILKNVAGHGRSWERLSLVRLFRDGKETLSTFSGVRLQGGNLGREKGLINFRVFFREEYGRSRVAGATFFDEPVSEIKRLAIKKSEWEKWPLNSPISYDISRKIGALAPVTELVNLYLNGKELGLYYIVPHLGETQLKLMLPEGEYQYFRYRGGWHPADRRFLSSEFFEKVDPVEEMTEEYARELFDLENLTAQLFSYIFNATGDFCQGIVLKGTAPGSKLFWYSWDMDYSIIDYKYDAQNQTSEPPRKRWEQPFSDVVFGTEVAGARHKCPRVHLFRRLMTEDPDFRLKVRDKFMEFMNHRVTDEFLAELIAEYREKLELAEYVYGDEYMDIVADFYGHRKEFLIKEMEKYVPTPPAKSCRVIADRYPVTIDGYEKNSAFEGHYFPGSKMTLSAAQEKGFKYWQVGDEKIMENNLELLLSSEQSCTIRAVFE